jgi:Papain-like cysteine protease AvrRpt2
MFADNPVPGNRAPKSENSNAPRDLPWMFNCGLPANKAGSTTHFSSPSTATAARRSSPINSILPLPPKAEVPQDYTASGWQDLLQKNGPLWVTTNEGTSSFSVHARILIGIHGDGSPDATFLKIIDPADASTVSQSLLIFTQHFDQVATNDIGAGADLRPQVVHF